MISAYFVKLFVMFFLLKGVGYRTLPMRMYVRANGKASMWQDYVSEESEPNACAVYLCLQGLLDLI